MSWSLLIFYFLALSVTPPFTTKFLLCAPLSHPSFHNLVLTVWPSKSPLPLQPSSACRQRIYSFGFSKAIKGVATNLFLLSPSCRSLERAGVGGGGEDIKKIWIVDHFLGNYLSKFFRNAYSQDTRIVWGWILKYGNWVHSCGVVKQSFCQREMSNSKEYYS